MDIEEELLGIFSSFEEGREGHGESTGAGSQAIDMDAMTTEIYEALKAAEVSALKAELEKLRPLSVGSAMDSTAQSSRVIESSADAPPPPHNANTVENHNIAPTAVSTMDTVAPTDDVVVRTNADDIAVAKEVNVPERSNSAILASTKEYKFPAGLRSSIYSYALPSRHQCSEAVSLPAAAKAAVVYWCAPGVARVRGNAALGLAADCARSLDVPVIAVAIEDAALYATAAEVSETADNYGNDLFMGIKRKYMFRLGSLCGMETECCAIGVPVLSCVTKGPLSSVTDIFGRIQNCIDSDNGEVIVFTDFVSNIMHQQQCLSLATGAEALKGVQVYGVEYGAVMSLLGSLHTRDPDNNPVDIPTAKRPRLEAPPDRKEGGCEDNTKIIPIPSLEEFSVVYMEAVKELASSSCIGDTSADFPLNVTSTNLQRAAQLCNVLCGGSKDNVYNKNMEFPPLSRARWKWLRSASERYRVAAVQNIASLQVVPSSVHVWGYTPKEAKDRIYNELAQHPGRNRAAVEGETGNVNFCDKCLCLKEACHCAWRCHDIGKECNCRKVLAVKSLIDLTLAAGSFGQREVIRDLLLPGTTSNANIWKEVCYYFLTAEYSRYCIFIGEVTVLLSQHAEISVGLNADRVLNAPAVKKLVTLMDTIKQGRDGRKVFPAEVFAASTFDAAFNACQIALLCGAVVPDLEMGLYWLLFLLSTLPTPEMAVRIALSEISMNSLYHVDTSEAMATTHVAVLLEGTEDPLGVNFCEVLEKYTSTLRMDAKQTLFEWCAVFNKSCV